MLPAPSPSIGRGDVVLQPNYFTSSIYVKALRDDLSMLILKYYEVYSHDVSMKPFSLFKTVWLSMGWNWLHFKVFDNRSRHKFLEVTLRLFLGEEYYDVCRDLTKVLVERTVKTEAPFTRVVSLFAVYTFFYTQVKDPIPSLYSVANIPISYGKSLQTNSNKHLKNCLDHYQSLMKMADSLTSQQVIALQPHVRHVLSRLRKDCVFIILPKSDLGPMNPRDLPREVHTEDGFMPSDLAQKRKGRPSKGDKGKKARLALDKLDELLSKPEGSMNDFSILADYQLKKTVLLESGIPAEFLQEINHTVFSLLKETTSPDGEADGLQRIERAMAEGGILGLLK